MNRLGIDLWELGDSQRARVTDRGEPGALSALGFRVGDACGARRPRRVSTRRRRRTGAMSASSKRRARSDSRHRHASKAKMLDVLASYAFGSAGSTTRSGTARGPRACAPHRGTAATVRSGSRDRQDCGRAKRLARAAAPLGPGRSRRSRAISRNVGAPADSSRRRARGALARVVRARPARRSTHDARGDR